MTVEYFRVDHHDQAWDLFIPLVHDAAVRATAQISEATAWLHLGWYRGPHLLVGVASRGELDEEMRTRILDGLNATIAGLPSMHDVDSDDWERRSIALAREELIEGPYIPIVEDNTVTVIDRDEARIYLDDDVATIMGRLIATGTESVLHARALGPAAVNEWAFTGMAELAASYRGGGLERGYLSYLSHWKEYIHWHPMGSRIEHAWKQAYTPQSAKLRETVRAAASRETSAEWSVSDWRHWSSNALDVATRSAKAGQLQVSRPESWLDRANHIEPAAVGRWELADNRTYSDFHEQFRKLDTTQFGLGTEFASYRFVESVQFRLFLLAGIAAADRTALAYFLSRAVEDELAIDWRGIIDRGLEQQIATAVAHREVSP